MFSSLWSKISFRSRRRRQCDQGRILYSEWHAASAPCYDATLELLDLYDERKSLARSDFMAHQQLCGTCRSASHVNPARKGTASMLSRE